MTNLTLDFFIYTVLPTVILLGIAIALLFVFPALKKKKFKFNSRILIALGLGLIFGLFIKFIISPFDFFNGTPLDQLSIFLNLIGDIYINLLKLIVIPLVFVAMTTSIMHLTEQGAIAKIVPKVIAILMITVSISALVGIGTALVANIDGEALTAEATDTDAESVAARNDALAEHTEENETYADFVLAAVPDNVFAMFAGLTSSATLSTVLFGMFLGYSILQVRKRTPEKVQSFVDFMDASKEVVLSLVREILKITPFAIFALISTLIIDNSLSAVGQIGKFLLFSYIAIFIMFMIHFLILGIFKLNPITYIRKAWPVFVFGFSSRSSLASLPLNVEAQNEEMGVDIETANISGTFGTSIGQNGCAGIYPAMLAVMTAITTGVDIDFSFIVLLVIVIAISSFGIAGVGGGATIAAITVLTIMGLPIIYVAPLISVEPLIDMARTALNISDSMVTGVVTAKINKTIDLEQYNK